MLKRTSKGYLASPSGSVFGGGVSFLPSSLPSLAAWYRYGLGITSATNAVSQWDDASGNARHLKQTTGAAQPTLQGDNSILFDGSADFLKADAFTLNQPTTIYLLGRWVTWTSNDCMFGGNATSTGILQQTVGTPQVRAFAGTGLGTISPTLNTYCVQIVVFNGASSVLQLNSGAPVTGAGGASNMAGFTLGSNDGSVQFGNIEMKEVVIYSVAHDAATRTRVLNYLAKVGNITV